MCIKYIPAAATRWADAEASEDLYSSESANNIHHHIPPVRCISIISSTSDEDCCQLIGFFQPIAATVNSPNSSTILVVISGLGRD